MRDRSESAWYTGSCPGRYGRFATAPEHPKPIAPQPAEKSLALPVLSAKAHQVQVTTTVRTRCLIPRSRLLRRAGQCRGSNEAPRAARDKFSSAWVHIGGHRPRRRLKRSANSGYGDPTHGNAGKAAESGIESLHDCIKCLTTPLAASCSNSAVRSKTTLAI